MSSRSDVPRWATRPWTQGAEPPEGLRRLIELSRRRLGTDADVAALAHAVARALGPAAGLPSTADLGPTTHLPAAAEPATLQAPAEGSGARAPEVTARAPAGLARWAAVGLGGIVSGAALWWALTASPSSEPLTHPGATDTGKLPAALAPAASSETPLAPKLSGATQQEQAQHQEQAPLASAASDASPAAQNVRSPAASLTPRVHRPPQNGQSEAELLERAEAALSSQPERALALTREHRQRFPHAVLVQEREVIAIEALKRLGRDRAARDRAKAFGERYRGSVHETRIQNPTPSSAATERPSGGF
jgi:hypothetical protein